MRVHERVLSEVAPHHYFTLQDGKVLKSLKDLLNELPRMDDGVFVHHVNDVKHDFSVWIEHCVTHPKLAARAAAARSRIELVKVLKTEIALCEREQERRKGKEASTALPPLSASSEKKPVEKPAPKRPAKKAVNKKVPMKAPHTPAPKRPAKKAVKKKHLMKHLRKQAAKKPVKRKVKRTGPERTSSPKKSSTKAAPVTQRLTKIKARTRPVPKRPAEKRYFQRIVDFGASASRQPKRKGRPALSAPPTGAAMKATTMDTKPAKTETTLPDLPNLPDLPDLPTLDMKEKKHGLFSRMFKKKEKQEGLPGGLVSDIPLTGPPSELPPPGGPKPMREGKKGSKKGKEEDARKGLAAMPDLPDLPDFPALPGVPEPPKKDMKWGPFGKKKEKKEEEGLSGIPALPEPPKLPDLPDLPSLPEPASLPDLEPTPFKLTHAHRLIVDPIVKEKKRTLAQDLLPEVPLPGLPDLEGPEVPALHDIVEREERRKKGFFGRLFGRKEKALETKREPDEEPFPEPLKKGPKEPGLSLAGQAPITIESPLADLEAKGKMKKGRGKPAAPSLDPRREREYLDKMKRIQDHELRERHSYLKQMEQDFHKKGMDLAKKEQDLLKREKVLTDREDNLTRPISIRREDGGRKPPKRFLKEESELKRRIVALVEEKNRLNLDIIEKRQELADIRKEYEGIVGDIKAHERIVAEKEDEIVKAATAIRRDKRLITDEEKSIVAGVERIMRAKKEYEATIRKHQKGLSKLLRDVKENELRLEALDEAIRKKQDEIKLRNRELDEQRKLLAKEARLKAGIGQLTLKRDKLEKDYEELRKRFKVLEEKFLRRKSLKDKEEELMARERLLYERDLEVSKKEKSLKLEEKELEDLEFQHYLSENLADIEDVDYQKYLADVDEESKRAQDPFAIIHVQIKRARAMIIARRFEEAKDLFNQIKASYDTAKLPEGRKKQLYYEILELKTDIDLALLH
ncbi:hypothetical protein JXB02_06305 [Candidatus Woesearchaeota archaeon]|nr:hypothetical protein [Candidatus Woesearchaeota archaeon]